ncbi:hypothetical protein [Daejeonia sp. YH14]|uniref:hypothetical protein n=1 Tax=Daejeonia sp. YH14 TaxID=3439042 RepID=UPI003F492BA1
MDKQIQKLRNLVQQHLNQTKTDLEKKYGRPCKNSDAEVWFYRKYRWGIFKDEIAFIFEEDCVIDITLTEYIFWIEYRNIFYNRGENPEYKVIKLL